MKTFLLLLLLALPACADPWLSWDRQGGFAARHAVLTVSTKGEVTWRVNKEPARTLMLKPGELDRLAGEADVQAVSPKPVPVVPDGIVSRLQIGKQTIVWCDPQPIPPALKPLVLHLAELEKKLSQRR